MEILFLSHRIPFPPNKGDKIRSFALLKHLARNHRVHLACFVDETIDLSYRETVRRIAGGECLFVPLSQISKWARAGAALMKGETISASCYSETRVDRWIKKLLETYSIDHTVVFGSAVAPYLLEKGLIDPARAVLDMVDVDSDKWAQYAAASRGIARWVYGREARKLQDLECRAVSKFGATILSSFYEAETLAAIAPNHKPRIFAMSNGVDLEQFSEGAFPSPFSSTEFSIVMTGRMDYRPNADGAKWFMREVLPHIRHQVPNVRFYAVGAYPPAFLRADMGSDIVVTGHVPDVRPYIQNASVVVAPLRMARGIQNKVLEAMAMRKPVVATQAATRALAVSSGSELWIADEPTQFAKAVVAALANGDRFRVAQNGRKYVERYHNWTRNLSVIDEILARLGQTKSDLDGRMDAADEKLKNRGSASPIARAPSLAGIGR